MMEEQRKRNMEFLSDIAVFTALLFLLLWKSRMGFGGEDEAFYITLGQRLVQKDALFRDEWHIAQMSGIFLAPLYRLYLGVYGSTGGIVHGFRLYYIVFTFLTGFMIRFRFRKYRDASLAAAAVYILFSPFNIMALSYNTMGTGFLILAMLVYPEKKESRIRFVLCGILMAFAVLNHPFLIFLYVLLTVAALARPEVLSRRGWLYLSFGAWGTAACFLGAVFSNISLQEWMAAMPYVVDASHSTSMFHHIAVAGYYLWLAYGPFLLVLIAEVFLCLRKELLRKCFPYLLVLNTLAMFYPVVIHPYFPAGGGFSVLFLPTAVSGLLVQALYSCDRYVTSCFAASLFLSFMLAFSSNVGPNSFCCPLVFAAAMTVLLVHEHFPKGRIMTAVLLAMLCYFKVHEDFGGLTSTYTCRAESGPLAGLYGTAEQLEEYEDRLGQMDTVRSLARDMGVDLVTTRTWEYLELQKKICTPRTYLEILSREEFIEVKESYCRLHPRSFPALMVVDDENPYFKEGDSWLEQFEVLDELSFGTVYLYGGGRQ